MTRPSTVSNIVTNKRLQIGKLGKKRGIFAAIAEK